MLYTWGKIDYFANPPVQHVASLGCNASFERVDVDVTFIGAHLEIDTTPAKAPRPREETARNSTVDSGSSQTLIYKDLAEMVTDPQLLSPFFGTLVSSRYALPVADLGDRDRDDKVAAAVRFQHGVIQAQTLARSLVPAAATNATLATVAGPADTDAGPVYAARATDATARRRVVQDAASTRALEALLAIALALLVVGWLCVRQTDVLPLAPTTIAAVAALVAGGDVLERLASRDAGALTAAAVAWRPSADLAAALRAAGARSFGIGWGRVPDLEGRAAGGENENGARRFGIFAVGDEEEEDEGKGGSDLTAEASHDPKKWAFHEQITAYDNHGGSR